MKRYVLFLKIGLLVGLSLSIAFLLLKELYFTAVMCFIILLGTAFSLYQDQRKMLQKMEHLIANIHYGDMNLSFPIPSTDGPEANLTRAMNEALSAFRTRLYNVVVAEAETEAWQKLIRVLTHEIMNSIAPIISLSETVTERASSNGLNERDYSIMLQAMQTIHRRSKGLLDFVENYRKLTRIPVPMQQLFPVSSLFDDLRGLYPAGAVSFSFSVRPVDLRIYADRAMIEQVLINLLKNAVEACQERSYPEVRVNAFRREGVPVITVSDNGYGIVPEAMDKVFVPFFTTKQGGSGIGLSVCRQIMNRTGKDLIARALYHHSPRCNQVFISIDLGSIPEQLFESELFGYEKGAFTDARRDKPGRMEVASGGTLFLDEIGNLSLPMQAKLLTAIEKRQILRLGATRSVPIDVRLISATNMDIHAMVQEGTFRQDLLYRINTIELHIPPLRERGNDILLLADYFLDCYARKYKKKIGGLTRDAKTKLQSYAWPGNVRELQHAIERAVILSDGPMLRPENFMLHPAPAQKKGEPEELNLGVLEKEAIERALRRADGNITRAAELLGITRFALYRKLDKLGL